MTTETSWHLSRLLTSGGNRFVQFVDTETGKVLYRLPAHDINLFESMYLDEKTIFGLEMRGIETTIPELIVKFREAGFRLLDESLKVEVLNTTREMSILKVGIATYNVEHSFFDGYTGSRPKIPTDFFEQFPNVSFDNICRAYTPFNVEPVAMAFVGGRLLKAITRDSESITFHENLGGKPLRLMLTRIGSQKPSITLDETLIDQRFGLETFKFSVRHIENMGIDTTFKQNDNAGPWKLSNNGNNIVISSTALIPNPVAIEVPRVHCPIRNKVIATATDSLLSQARMLLEDFCLLVNNSKSDTFAEVQTDAINTEGFTVSRDCDTVYIRRPFGSIWKKKIRYSGTDCSKVLYLGEDDLKTLNFVDLDALTFTLSKLSVKVEFLIRQPGDKTTSEFLDGLTISPEPPTSETQKEIPVSSIITAERAGNSVTISKEGKEGRGCMTFPIYFNNVVHLTNAQIDFFKEATLGNIEAALKKAGLTLIVADYQNVNDFQEYLVRQQQRFMNPIPQPFLPQQFGVPPNAFQAMNPRFWQATPTTQAPKELAIARLMADLYTHLAQVITQRDYAYSRWEAGVPFPERAQLQTIVNNLNTEEARIRQLIEKTTADEKANAKPPKENNSGISGEHIPGSAVEKQALAQFFEQSAHFDRLIYQLNIQIKSTKENVTGDLLDKELARLNEEIEQAKQQAEQVNGKILKHLASVVIPKPSVSVGVSFFAGLPKTAVEAVTEIAQELSDIFNVISSNYRETQAQRNNICEIGEDATAAEMDTHVAQQERIQAELHSLEVDRAVQKNRALEILTKYGAALIGLGVPQDSSTVLDTVSKNYREALNSIGLGTPTPTVDGNGQEGLTQEAYDYVGALNELSNMYKSQALVAFENRGTYQGLDYAIEIAYQQLVLMHKMFARHQ